mgnify:CR=1 FL=1
MTTATLYETIQRIVQEELRRQQTAALATVQESHPHSSDGDTDNYACSVVLRDTGLVLNQVPVATSRIGHVSIPHPGDLVLVQFVGGDLNAPVITGSFYTDQTRPPVSQENQSLWQLPAGADSAVRLELKGDSTREIQLQVGDACVVRLVDDATVVSVDVDGGQAVVQIDRNGDVKVTSNANLELEANAITLKAQSEMSLEAGGNIKIKGAVVNIN